MSFIKKNTWFMTIILILTMEGIFALPSITDFLTDEERALLNGQGEITEFHFGDTTPVLIPDVSQSEELQEILAGLEANFSIEGLFFIPRRDRIEGDGEILEILNLLSSVSRIQGLEYFSASRGEMRLLFEECWRIENEKNKKPVEDLSFQNLPETTSFIIHQKDLTFGSNISHVEMHTASDSLLMTMKNLSNMKYNGLIKVINKGNFQTGVLVIPVEEGILYYGVMSAKTLGLGFIVDKASNSFYNRMKALFNWFSAEYQ